VTVRPVGHPFYREVRLDPGTMAAWASFRGQVFAVVDEGPGLSGSSFGAVADWLEANGTPREDIHFFPSHAGGLGPQASPSHRERWSGAARHSIDMDQLLVQSSGQRNLTAWVEEVLGPLDQPMEDLYGGAWRMRRYPTEEAWPAVNAQMERRKFLARAGGTSWLVKFIGLDERSLQKVQRARNLHQAGFTPEIAGYRYGFLIERWHEDARPLDRAAFDRRQLVEHVGAYLGFRALHLPSKTGEGASLGLLRHMARHNTQQVLGQDAGAAIECRLSQSGQLEERVRRVDTDNRMHLWKWLVLGDGVLKTDALDHSANHDLVGHQDVTWDIAGAMVELSLAEEETSRLCTVVEHESGYPVDREILKFLLPCYLAFQIGDHVLATHALGNREETTRLRRRIDVYASLLRNVLEG
jgi:hypothetical protein